MNERKIHSDRLVKSSYSNKNTERRYNH